MLLCRLLGVLGLGAKGAVKSLLLSPSRPVARYALKQTGEDRCRRQQASLYPVVMMSLPLSELSF
jgi:hypothetical protein